MKPVVYLAAGVVWGVALLFAAIACTPAQRAAIPAEERATCVLLRAIDPRVAPYCATADELAPFVPELIAASSRQNAPAPAVAFAMPAPKRAAPRRHCTQWTFVDAGAVDASAEASP